jgi:outer membrane protein insertion porin family
MQLLQRLCAFGLVAFLSAQAIHAQQPVSIDPKLLELENPRQPKEYTIAEIKVTGTKFLDSSIILSISALQVGEKLFYPGTDKFSKAVQNLWNQKLFSAVELYFTKVEDDRLSLEIFIKERQRLGEYKFYGIKKSDQDELKGKIGLARATLITENFIINAKEVIYKFYSEKGFKNVNTRIEETQNKTLPNSNDLAIYIDKGGKVRNNAVNFYGNDNVSEQKLKKQMKGTKEMSKFTLFPKAEPSPYGVNKKMSFKEYLKNKGYFSLSKTKTFIDPYFRFKFFSSAKFDPKKYEEDKTRLVEYYNSQGFRDAEIVSDTQYKSSNGNLNVDVKVKEGRKYYFGNISWKGNTKYSDSVLNNILGIRKGDVYDLELLRKRLGPSSDGSLDVNSVYQDDGHLFFSIEPVETSVYNDTIDYEMRMREGPQATIGTVGIFGNDKTKDHVIRRELRTVPGEKFSRSDIIRSVRELGGLNFFNQEKIDPQVVPHPEEGTVDINWRLEEKSSDQLELSAGWGGGIGLTGTLGVSFNNFSLRNITKKSAWDPLPTGDGQKLSVRFQSNGRAFRSYNLSFTEPWLGGKKRNPLTVSVYSSKFSNAFDPFTGLPDKKRSDTNFLKTLGVTLSLGKQLKWPDDYFSIVYSLNFTRYTISNYPIFQGLSDGVSTNVSFKVALSRSSVFNPTFPTSGSTITASVALTPPYSLFNKNILNSANPYKNPEYHKWRFNAEWFVPIGRAGGADKNRQMVLKMAAKYGFMGRYNTKLDFSPFERFQVGDAGLTNNFGLLGYDIVAHRGYPVYENSNPSINPDQQNANRFFTIFNKYQLELRYPVVTNPGSTIYALTFFEAANGWYSFKDYNPFRLRRSAGVGMRFFLPMFGLLGFDYGIGFDRIQPGAGNKLKDAARFTFMLGFEPE